MEKRIIENNEEEDTVIRAVRAKREEREKIRLEKDAYITRVISEMEAEMVFIPETVRLAIQTCEEVIENHNDEKAIRIRIHIEDPGEEAAKVNAYRKVVGDESLENVIDAAYEVAMNKFRHRVADGWNKNHPNILAECRGDKYLYIGYNK